MNISDPILSQLDDLDRFQKQNEAKTRHSHVLENRKFIELPKLRVVLKSGYMIEGEFSHLFRSEDKTWKVEIRGSDGFEYVASGEEIAALGTKKVSDEEKLEKAS